MNEDVFNKNKQQISQGCWVLPIIKIGDKKYFRDDRLQEFRNVDDFMDVITFNDYILGSYLAEIVNQGKADVSITNYKDTGNYLISVVPKSNNNG